MGLSVYLLPAARRVAPMGDNEGYEAAERQAHNDGVGWPMAVYNIEQFRDRQDGLEDGYYVAGEGHRASHVFGMPYSSYNDWRRHVCRAVHGVEPEVIWQDQGMTEGEAKHEYDGEPLVALINFADNEGAFGPNHSGRLALEMAANVGQLSAYAAASGVDDETLVEVYSSLRVAFEEAARTGGVVVWA